MGDQGFGHFIFLSVCWSGTIDLAVMKSPDNSASEAKDMTTLIIWDRDRIAPLFHGDRVIVRAKYVLPCKDAGASFIEVCHVKVCKYYHADGSISYANIEIISKVVQ